MSFNLDEKYIHIWIIELETSELKTQDLRNYLNPDEKLRSERFHSTLDRNKYITSHATLQILLQRYLGINKALRYSENENGKPFLSDHSLHFNLSHSGDFALIAVSKNIPLGIDIEMIKENPNFENLARRFFSVSEADEIAALPHSEQTDFFYRLWTQKEACLKALGLGISSIKTLNKHNLSVQELAIHPQYKAALAAPGKDWDYELRQWNAFK